MANEANVLPSIGGLGRGASGPFSLPQGSKASARYAAAVLLVTLAIGLKVLFGDALGSDVPFLLLFGAVTLAAWYGGAGPALLATGLVTLVTWRFFLPAQGAFTVVQLAVFLVECGAIISISSSLQRSRHRAERLAVDLIAAHEARFASEARLGLMVDNVRDYAILMLEPDGTVTSWNLGAERINGYSAEEIIGRHFSIFHTEEDRQSGHPQKELQLARERGRFQEEGWRIRKDGTRFWADVTITPIHDERGAFIGFGKVTRDMTDRRNAEEELRRANEQLEQRVRERTMALAATNNELEAFSYSVSHDLRAPLRGVDGFANILLQKYSASLDEKGRHYLERIRAASQRMARLIDDLLRLSRITRAELRRAPVDLGALAAEVASDLRQADPGRQVEILIADDLRARGDRELLRIVIENLVGNAWKFTSKTEEARIEVGTAVHDGERSFFVRDNGVGFEMEYRDKLFTPFQRLHEEAEFEGTGIGLATVQRIVRRHGGRVWAEGKPNEGATFSFTLPEGATP
jgi:PAS domain S-box-containing protein